MNLLPTASVSSAGPSVPNLRVPAPSCAICRCASADPGATRPPLRSSLAKGQFRALASVRFNDNDGLGDAGAAALFAGLETVARRVGERRAARAQRASMFVRIELRRTESAQLAAGALARAIHENALRALGALDVSFNCINPTGFKELARALARRGCPLLHELNVSNNLGGDEGVHELCAAIEAHGIGRLRFLDISTNRAKGSMMHLASVLANGAPCPQLRVLVIHGATPFDDRPERLFLRIRQLTVR